jgi:hypothetical protein
MLRVVAVLFFLAATTLAADFKPARVVDFQDVSEVAGGTINGLSSNGVAVTPTSRVPSAILKCEVTLQVEGKTYTVLFAQDQHFRMTDLERGKFIPVRLEGKKLAMQRPSDGKEIKGKIIREADEDSSPKN